ncbi:hypothetical protein [Streptomyces chartreusis]|uniref:Uncharacterized protein n=1 Tax=Streptomyces chartreusis TaxID=1969 RepID=A0A7H8TF73_STRCX|nr:hypothetical protein [Streptomyces chartreusis]QKZ22055.1 hypothetical protein HUT05_34730 [Streptomyces chartreusis]
MPRRNVNVNRSRYPQIESVDLTRVEETPAPRPLPAKLSSRRRALRVRGW